MLMNKRKPCYVDAPNLSFFVVLEYLSHNLKLIHRFNTFEEARAYELAHIITNKDLKQSEMVVDDVK